jgi:hypothetical protein
MLVAARKVSYSHSTKQWTVGSQAQGARRYVVSMGADGRPASCQCQDALYGAPGGCCKHRLAVQLVLDTDRIMAMQQRSRIEGCKRASA